MKEKAYSMLHKTKILNDWREVVNMTADEVERWLRDPRSRRCGMQRTGERETVGRKSGRRIVKMLRAGHDGWSASDWAWARKVVGYCKRHLAERRSEWGDDIEERKWTWSLRNWGHDPVKD